MKCYECKWLDRSVVLTSIPPQYRCTLGFGTHYADHECESIVRCEDCVHCADDYTCDLFEGYVVNIKPGHYCSYGERRSDEGR